MALEATHIRFALDIKNKYEIKDIKKYVSGAIYPDSRYVTKTDRNLTHNENIVLPEFAKDDFKKGWQAHQICDYIQNKITREIFSDTFLKKHSGHNVKEWIISSAIKIIQDMSDMQKFDIQSCLKYLEYVENPNGEDIEKVKKYNQIMINLYKDKKITSIDDNYKMWRGLGISKKHGEKIKIKTEEFLNNKKIVKKIKTIYDKTIIFYKKNY